MRWLKSFYLHSFLNRFNMAYIALWAGVCWTTEGNLPFWIGLAVEAGYLAGRSWLEAKSSNPFWRIRTIGWTRRNRFLALWERADAVKRDLARISGVQGLMAASGAQIDKLIRLFIDMLIAEEKIDKYMRIQRADFGEQILELQRKLAGAQGEMANILEKNIELTRQRSEKYRQVTIHRDLISARLNTIENTIGLLKESAIGLGMQPENLTSNVEALVQNVSDAQSLVSEFQQVENLINVGS